MAKYKITIKPDEYSDNPLEYTPEIIVACKHRRYNLGNMRLNDLLSQYDYNGDYDNLKEIMDYMSTYGTVFPVSMTDHSYLSVYVGKPMDRWDSGYIGIVFIQSSDMSKYGYTESDINNILDTYTQYLNSEVYTYVVEKYTSDGMEYVNSCCGYYDIDDCKEDALTNVPESDKDNIEFVYLA